MIYFNSNGAVLTLTMSEGVSVKTQSVESDVAIAVNDIAMKYELLTTQINSITSMSISKYLQ